MPKSYILKSFLNALGTFVYVGLIALLLSSGERIFGGGPDSPLIPVFMLLLFVVSATITSLLVLGKPIHLYLSGLKKEAFTFLFATLGWLVVFMLIIGLVMVIL